MPTQRKRGASFRGTYCDIREDYEIEESVADRLEPFKRSPSLPSTGDYLLPPQSHVMRGRLTVVLDLDETLIYARHGPLYVRPGMEALMEFLAAHCETVVWTSSRHRYADAVVAQIDHVGAVQHLVYRHRRWLCGSAGTKDLALLGRDPERTVIIENTPDCIRGYEGNAILVEDYEGGELQDDTLYNLVSVLKEMVQAQHEQGMSVPTFIASSPRLSKRDAISDRGTPLTAFCLDSLWAEEEEECVPFYPAFHKAKVSARSMMRRTEGTYRYNSPVSPLKAVY